MHSGTSVRPFTIYSPRHTFPIVGLAPLIRLVWLLDLTWRHRNMSTYLQRHKAAFSVLIQLNILIRADPIESS
jgi:hypothetical protein